MRLLHTLVLIIFATSCMAQSTKDTSRKDELDCSTITSSPQLDDCVRKEMMTSNAHLKNELVNFEKRVKQSYSADPKLGKELINRVRESQHAWISFRKTNCSIDAFEIEKGTPAYITTVNNCIIRMNAERIKELKKLPH